MKHRIIIVWSEEKNFVGLCREWKSQTVSSFCCLCVEMCVRVFFLCEDSKDNEITNYGIRDVELKRLIEYLCLKSELGKKHFFSVTKLGWDCPLNYIYYIKSIWRIHKKVCLCVFFLSACSSEFGHGLLVVIPFSFVDLVQMAFHIKWQRPQNFSLNAIYIWWTVVVLL